MSEIGYIDVACWALGVTQTKGPKRAKKNNYALALSSTSRNQLTNIILYSDSTPPVLYASMVFQVCTSAGRCGATFIAKYLFFDVFEGCQAGIQQ